MKKIVVIGAGFSSLSASCYLAAAGYDVTVVEKNATPGGRASRMIADGFTFDLGPTWYWMPDIFEKFFADFGKTPDQYYSLSRLDPSYRLIGKEGEVVDVPADTEKLFQLFESVEKGSSAHLKKFLSLCKESYSIATGEMMYKPGRSPIELLSTDTLLHLDMFFQSLRSVVRKNFRNPLLRSLLEFPVLFLGATPSNTPAFYCFMNYADLKLGTWYPEKGFYSVVEGIHRLATQLGVKFIFNAGVRKISIEGKIATGVQTEKGLIDADVILSGADYYHTEQLLDPAHRSYSESYWDKKTLAPSALLFFIGLNKKLDNQLHHTLFFDSDFDKHAKQIYDMPEWPTDPLFYVSIPSVTDASVAPEGCENITILIPLAAGLKDTEILREHLFHLVIDRLEKFSGQSIRESIVFKKSYCVNDFVENYNSYKGNAYGLATTLSQTAFLRPAVCSKKVDNLFFTGQLTVPGPGVPPSLVSGKIAANQIMKRTLVIA